MTLFYGFLLTPRLTSVTGEPVIRQSSNNAHLKAARCLIQLLFLFFFFLPANVGFRLHHLEKAMPEHILHILLHGQQDLVSASVTHMQKHMHTHAFTSVADMIRFPLVSCPDVPPTYYSDTQSLGIKPAWLDLRYDW